MEKEFKSLSDEILTIMDTPKGYGILFCNVINIKEFIKIITEASDENDFDIMVEDGEDGEITISFSEFIKKRAGDKLITKS